MKVFCATFLFLKFEFVIFCQKEIGAKVVGKMLMKLTLEILILSTKYAEVLAKLTID